MSFESIPSDELAHWITTGNWEKIAFFLSGLTSEQYNAQAHFAKGLLLTYGPARQRNLDHAILSLESACALEPDNVQSLSTLAEALLQEKQSRRSLETAKKARIANSKNAMAAVALGRAAWACRDRELAYQSFQDASKLLPKTPSPVSQQVNDMAFKLAPFWWVPLKGKNLSLVRMNAIHYDFVLKCRNNASFQQHYNLFQKTSPEDVKADLKRSEQPPLINNKIEWVVEKNGSPIGLVALVDLDVSNLRAEILVGFPEKVSSFNTVESTLLVLEFAFSVLGLEKICSYVYSDNPHGQRCSMHLGFNQEGLLKSHINSPASKKRLDLCVNGYFPEIFYGITVSKLFKRLLGRAPQKTQNYLKTKKLYIPE